MQMQQSLNLSAPQSKSFFSAQITTASSSERTNLRINKFFWILTGLFFIYWIYGFFYCLNLQDWIIENVLVVICLSIVVISQKWLRLSDLSYLCIFSFVMLHLYGALYAYTHNALGEWLRNTYHLWRNPYDRIVHFSFGFFLAYPFRELLINKFRVSSRASWLMPVEIAFSLGTVFEMIEWGVAEFTTKETGETYVATQGDVWDAHKDIAMAAIGAAFSMLIVYFIKRRKSSSVKS
jgi:putative membrane protein